LAKKIVATHEYKRVVYSEKNKREADRGEEPLKIRPPSGGRGKREKVGQERAGPEINRSEKRGQEEN